MRIRLLNLFIIFIMLFSVLSMPANASDIKLFVDKSAVEGDVPPVIKNDRTLVPARAFFEHIKAEVYWNDVRKQVKINLNDTKIILVIGSNVAYVNSVIKVLDTVPIIMNDRTMIPVRFVSETLGYKVSWDADSRSVHIDTTVEKPVQKPEENESTSKSRITSMVYSVSGKSFIIKFTFSSPLSGYKLYNLDNPVRTVLELTGATYGSSKLIEVGSGGIDKFRTANHESHYKIVADLEQVLQKKFVLSTDKCSATLMITGISEFDEKLIKSDIPSTDEIISPEEDEDEDEDKPEIIYDKYWEVTDDSLVVLDAGHGGTDVGAIGYNEKGEKVVYEKDVNLAITLEVARILKEKGINILLTRPDDSSISLSKRYNISNTNDALLFVSIHHNSHTNSDPSGSLTLYSEAKDTKYPNLKSSKSIAKTIQKHLTEYTDLYDGGIRSEDELAVLRGTETSAVLVEVAFVSNYDDQKFMLDKENLNKAAAGIAAGIIEVLEK